MNQTICFVLNFTKRRKRQPDCKPGYVDNCLPVRHLSLRRVATVANKISSAAVYPPAMDEQPLDAGILDLATHWTCGTPSRGGARWALTPPFHPCRNPCARGSGGCSLSRCPCGRPQLSVKKNGALCCPDFPPATRGDRRRTVRLPLFVPQRYEFSGNIPTKYAPLLRKAHFRF